jgi:hypothetical protein
MKYIIDMQNKKMGYCLEDNLQRMDPSLKENTVGIYIFGR